MKMPFNEKKAISETIRQMNLLEDFYRTYIGGTHMVDVKIEDLYFLNVRDGWVYAEYNDPATYYQSELCNVKHCHESQEELENKIRSFFYNIGTPGN